MRKTLSYLYRQTPKVFNEALKFYKGNFIKALEFSWDHFLVRNHTHASLIDGKYNWIKANGQDVVDIMIKLCLYNQKVHIVKGWFNETTPHSPAKKIMLLHCDGDLYESTKSTLDSFYHKVVKGGYIVSNDYGDVWIGAKKAVDECVAALCPEVKIIKIEGGGAYFRKP